MRPHLTIGSCSKAFPMFNQFLRFQEQVAVSGMHSKLPPIVQQHVNIRQSNFTLTLKAMKLCSLLPGHSLAFYVPTTWENNLLELFCSFVTQKCFRFKLTVAKVLMPSKEQKIDTVKCIKLCLKIQPSTSDMYLSALPTPSPPKSSSFLPYLIPKDSPSEALFRQQGTAQIWPHIPKKIVKWSFLIAFSFYISNRYPWHFHTDMSVCFVLIYSLSPQLYLCSLASSICFPSSISLPFYLHIQSCFLAALKPINQEEHIRSKLRSSVMFYSLMHLSLCLMFKCVLFKCLVVQQ